MGRYFGRVEALVGKHVVNVIIGRASASALTGAFIEVVATTRFWRAMWNIRASGTRCWLVLSARAGQSSSTRPIVSPLQDLLRGAAIKPS